MLQQATGNIRKALLQYSTPPPFPQQENRVACIVWKRALAVLQNHGHSGAKAAQTSHLCPISSPTSPTRPCLVFARDPPPPLSTLTSVLVVRRFALWSEWDDTEAAHWLLPRANVIDSFVVQVLMQLQGPLLTRSLT